MSREKSEELRQLVADFEQLQIEAESLPVWEGIEWARVLSTLDAIQRQVAITRETAICLAIRDGMSMAEAARHIGTTRQAVHKLVTKRLREPSQPALSDALDLETGDDPDRDE